MSHGVPGPGDEDGQVRLPRQQRSRDSWQRVLDSGVAILEDGGYEAFTIAEVCRRAHVAPPAIYARAKTKEVLFLAVYEHGIERLRADQQQLGRAAAASSPAHHIRQLVGSVVGLLLRHRRFLGAVVLLSSSHAEVRRRGAGYSRELFDQFVDALQPVVPHLDHRDAEAALRACFDVVFSSTVFRIAYGPDFATAGATDDDDFTRGLADIAVRYLLPTRSGG